MVKIKRLTPDWWATVGAFEARVDVEVDDSNVKYRSFADAVANGPNRP